MDTKKENQNKLKSKEPVFIIRPAFKNFGLDYLHIMLIALVIILVVLAFALSTFKQGTVITNCQYGSNSNSTCNSTVHNTSQVLGAAERSLASYSFVNTSLNLIPYYSLVNQSRIDYLSNEKEWLVVIPYIDPLANNTKFNISLTLYDSNLTLASASLQTIKSIIPTKNNVVALGTINLYNEVSCKSTKPIPVYTITDPYAPGTFEALYTTINATKHFNNSINASYFFIFSGYSQHFYSSYGISETQQIGRYLSCASNQRNFPEFLSNLSIAYTGLPISNLSLYQIALGSNLNTSELNGCMQNVTTRLNYESQFASLYNITSTPSIIVNCRYSTIPQTINYAINYSLNNLNN